MMILIFIRHAPINFHFLTPFTCQTVIFFLDQHSVIELLNPYHPSLKLMTKYTINKFCDSICFKIASLFEISFVPKVSFES